VSNACKIWIKKGRGEPWQEHDPNGELVALRAKVERLERENAALRDARRVAEQVCTEAFAKVFAEYAAKTLTKDTQP